MQVRAISKNSDKEAAIIEQSAQLHLRSKGLSIDPDEAISRQNPAFCSVSE